MTRKKREKKYKTMNEAYGDGSPHRCCPDCGFCITCGDCVCEKRRQGKIAKQIKALKKEAR
jgi:hypothetical protein